jgi:hypothetical protein
MVTQQFDDVPAQAIDIDPASGCPRLSGPFQEFLQRVVIQLVVVHPLSREVHHTDVAMLVNLLIDRLRGVFPSVDSRLRSRFLPLRSRWGWVIRADGVRTGHPPSKRVVRNPGRATALGNGRHGRSSRAGRSGSSLRFNIESGLRSGGRRCPRPWTTPLLKIAYRGFRHGRASARVLGHLRGEDTYAASQMRAAKTNEESRWNGSPCREKWMGEGSGSRLKKAEGPSGLMSPLTIDNTDPSPVAMDLAEVEIRGHVLTTLGGGATLPCTE